jgi:hypothetical protein
VYGDKSCYTTFIGYFGLKNEDPIMPENNPIETSLVNIFDPNHVKSALGHFVAATEELQKGNWELCIVKGGKFVEAILKILCLHVGDNLPYNRQFKVNAIINELKKLPIGTFSDSIRLTIPRACEFIYDIASNRGGRHDTNEVDPNEMDATIIIETSSWILAELVRYSQKGRFDQSQVKDQIQGIIQRRYPDIETVDGRTYFHFNGLSGRQVALLALWHQHPKRMTRTELFSVIKQHGFSEMNAKTSLGRINKIVDIDSEGKYRILSPGLEEVEKIFKINQK